MTLQPQRFHAPLHQRHRMVIPLIVQDLLNRGGKLQLHRHAHNLPDNNRTVSKTAIPPRGQYSWQWTRFLDYAADISTGPFGSILHQSDYTEGGIPLVNPSHIVNGQIVPDQR